MDRRLPAVPLVFVLVGAWLVLLAPAAHAACHIAGFVETDVEASRSTGVVSLVVELQGRVGSCAGTVDVATVDGTAVDGEDYEAVSQTLTFEEDDDRVETVDVTILADGEEGGDKTFTLELSNPTGDISGTGEPATVTITGDGGVEPADEAGTDDDVADEDAAVDAEESTDDEDEGGGTLGIVLAVVAAIAIGVGAFVLLRGRGG